MYGGMLIREESVKLCVETLLICAGAGGTDKT